MEAAALGSPWQEWAELPRGYPHPMPPTDRLYRDLHSGFASGRGLKRSHKSNTFCESSFLNVCNQLKTFSAVLNRRGDCIRVLVVTSGYRQQDATTGEQGTRVSLTISYNCT